MVEQARLGIYPIERAKEIPIPLLKKYCLRGVRSRDGAMRVMSSLTRRAHFMPANLLAPLPDIGRFDVIFLRNVMIYFDMETKRRVVDNVLTRLKPGGTLFIGHAETLQNVSDRVQLVKPPSTACWRTPDAGCAMPDLLPAPTPAPCSCTPVSFILAAAHPHRHPAGLVRVDYGLASALAGGWDVPLHAAQPPAPAQAALCGRYGDEAMGGCWRASAKLARRPRSSGQAVWRRQYVRNRHRRVMNIGRRNIDMGRQLLMRLASA